MPNYLVFKLDVAAADVASGDVTDASATDIQLNYIPIIDDGTMGTITHTVSAESNSLRTITIISNNVSFATPSSNGGFSLSALTTAYTNASTMEISSWAGTPLATNNGSGSGKQFYWYTGTFAANCGAPVIRTGTTLAYAFSGATGASYEDLDTWDTTNVTNMDATFKDATSFNQDIGLWHTTNVTSMWGMFMGATAYNNGGEDLNTANTDDWNVSSVTDFSDMFNGAAAFNQALGSWATTAATTMKNMFKDAGLFNQAVVHFDMRGVTDVSGMFSGASVFNQGLAHDANTWNLTDVTTAAGMFNGARAFNQNLSTWVVTSVTDMSTMFANTDAFVTNLDWDETADVAAVTNAKYMFQKSAYTYGLPAFGNTTLINGARSSNNVDQKNAETGGFNIAQVDTILDANTTAPLELSVNDLDIVLDLNNVLSVAVKLVSRVTGSKQEGAVLRSAAYTQNNAKVQLA